MARYLMLTVATFVLTTGAARAGGLPPMYVVVDRVVLEPNGDAPVRIKIEGTFVRLANVRTYEYGKPIEGFIDLSIEKGKENESRTEWAKWQKAAGTGKVVSVGSCGEAGNLLTVQVRKLGEKTDGPDAAYSTDYLGRFGNLYADGDWLKESPVSDLLAFVKAKKRVEPASRR